jgi:hypothetical protein
MVIIISWEAFPVQIIINQKQPENVEYFNYLGSMIKMMQNVFVKLKPGLPWEKQYSAKRRLFPPANWT